MATLEFWLTPDGFIMQHSHRGRFGLQWVDSVLLYFLFILFLIDLIQIELIVTYLFSFPKDRFRFRIKCQCPQWTSSLLRSRWWGRSQILSLGEASVPNAASLTLRPLGASLTTAARETNGWGSPRGFGGIGGFSSGNTGTKQENRGEQGKTGRGPWTLTVKWQHISVRGSGGITPVSLWNGISRILRAILSKI